jgi:hypothetical protein
MCLHPKAALKERAAVLHRLVELLRNFLLKTNLAVDGLRRSRVRMVLVGF